MLVAVVSLNVLISRAGFQADLSEERMHTLSAESVALINQIPKDRPVYVQAFYSPEVPREYVSTKDEMINLLKAFAAKGGDRIRLNLVEAPLYSDEAHETPRPGSGSRRDASSRSRKGSRRPRRSFSASRSPRDWKRW